MSIVLKQYVKMKEEEKTPLKSQLWGCAEKSDSKQGEATVFKGEI